MYARLFSGTLACGSRFRSSVRRTDTGVGISDARLEALFRAFEMVETVDPDEQSVADPAVGLGLAVVARIVRNLQGQLRVESKEGEGSKFSFTIPFRLPSIVRPLLSLPVSCND